MNEQEKKRGPGRPRTGRGTETITVTISKEISAILKAMPAGERSRFVDECLRQHPQMASRLEQNQAEKH